jgi:hypothetical protein
VHAFIIKNVDVDAEVAAILKDGYGSHAFKTAIGVSVTAMIELGEAASTVCKDTLPCHGIEKIVQTYMEYESSHRATRKHERQ